jgi:hypothetical protein
MNGSCPLSADLLALALGDDIGSRKALHVRGCEACRGELVRLRDAVDQLRASAVAASDPATECLGDDAIASLADGVSVDSETTLAHLVACGRCRRRLAAVSRLINDEAVTGEVRALLVASGGQAGRRHPSGRAVTLVAMASAAAVAALLFLPRNSVTPPLPPEGTAPVDRERAITTTAAPPIVGPAGITAEDDSLRWTGVPHADRYEVRVFDREGTLVWNPQTRDTVLAIPPALLGSRHTTYLWMVRARTGWDRWVQSEWSDLTTGPTGRR